MAIRKNPKFLVGSKGECQQFVSRIENEFDLLNDTTTSYAIPKQHFTKRNLWFVPIVEVVDFTKKRKITPAEMLSNGTTKEKTATMTMQDLIDDGAFDMDPDALEFI